MFFKKEENVKREIPKEYYERIISLVYWDELLPRLGFKFRRKKTGYLGNYQALCPFHKEKRPSLVFRVDGRYHCFGCSCNGDVFDFVKYYLFQGNQAKTCRWFRRVFKIPLPWENRPHK